MLTITKQPIGKLLVADSDNMSQTITPDQVKLAYSKKATYDANGTPKPKVAQSYFNSLQIQDQTVKQGMNLGLDKDYKPDRMPASAAHDYVYWKESISPSSIPEHYMSEDLSLLDRNYEGRVIAATQSSFFGVHLVVSCTDGKIRTVNPDICSTIKPKATLTKDDVQQGRCSLSDYLEQKHYNNR